MNFNEKIELPIVTEADTENKHVSLMLVSDGLRQAEQNLREQEENIVKYTEQIEKLQSQINNLQVMRIASTAQKNLLVELEKKIKEFSDSNLEAEVVTEEETDNNS